MESEIFDEIEYQNMINYYTAEVSKWFLMKSTTLVFAITASYLAFVTKIGPEIMKKRSPFNLNTILILYNAAQVVCSLFLVYGGLNIMINRDGFIHKKCIGFILSKEENLRTLSLGHLYVMAKLSELLDTIFFVLRKKQNQVTFLHVYHHAMMFTVSWLMIVKDPNEIFLFILTLNSAVHVMMYAYYGLAAFPSLKKYLWWKKYITSIQLIQFLIIFAQLLISYIISECPPSKVSLVFALFNALFFYYLFKQFYKKSYVETKLNVQEPQFKMDTKDNFSNGTQNGSQNGISNRKYKNETYNNITKKKYTNGMKNGNSGN